MRSLFHCLAFYLFIMQPGLAQTKTNNSLLWEVSGKGLAKPSYLFGTYHFATKSLVDSLPVIRQKFDLCQAAIGELVMDSAATEKVAGAMMLTKGSLDSLFTPEEYQFIKGKLIALMGETVADNFKKLKPAAVQLVFVGMTQPMPIPSPAMQLDSYFQTETKKRGGQVFGLETVEEQTNLLLNGNMEDQKKHLLKYLRETDKNKGLGIKLYQMYLKQDLDGLGDFMSDDSGYTQKEMDEFLKDRNLRWIAKLPALMQSQPSFIAVGAAHLIGEFGLIQQLRQKGYTVKAVKI